ncbi:hypothetical protein [Aquisphaera insulae]|uniref:hypothetical protein n=1 Tax=Aquisphaera insulae TaxID=2712864 RepID=UPI0013ECD269|nr:hypothetical protein [Aquisphaera insulae]
MAETERGGIPRTRNLTIAQVLDPAAVAIERGSILLGLFTAVHCVLRGMATTGGSGLPLLLGIAEGCYWLVAYVLTGFVGARILKALGIWLTGRDILAREVTEAPLPQASVITPAQTEPARPSVPPSIDAAEADEAGPDTPDEPRLDGAHDEHELDDGAAIENQLAQLSAARDVNDPERVLELHAALSPGLGKESRRELDADLSQWFLRLIHHRLRSGKIQPDLVQLAGRIADAFAHTHDGASLRASLPTLRRSAGLCPRCAKPYLGLAAACPECLAPSFQPVRLADEEEST